MPSSSDIVWWRGGRFDSNSIPSLLMAEKLSGLPIRVTQGGYSNAVLASAGTHSGGAVIDVSVSGWSRSQVNTMLTWLRRCGWAAWYRTPAQGFVYHIHAVRIGDKSASWGAQAQVFSYRNGRNGLANNRADDGPNVPVVTWEDCKYNPKNQPKPKPPYIINGKKYPYMDAMHVSWINDARKAKHKNVSRPVHRLQMWLSYDRSGKKGGWYTAKIDGIWGPKTQQAYDNFRKYTLKYKGSDATGAVGITSLKALGKRIAAKYKIVP